MRKKTIKIDKDSIQAMKIKEKETADASILFQKKSFILRLKIRIAEYCKPALLWLYDIRRRMGLKIILMLLLFVLGMIGGYYGVLSSRVLQNDKLVALRIGNAPQYVDYDMQAAINYLKYSLERNGYQIAGGSYAGNLYPKELNHVGVNVFVRGFPSFYDLRMSEDKTNILYVHRFADFYAEEFQNYDGYISSQQQVLNAFGDKVNIQLLPVGFVPHETVVPEHYEYDVLYIYEYYNPTFCSYMQRDYRMRIISGQSFAALSDQQKAQELAKAKVVVYEMGNVGRDDKTYVPYAVFDLISYGRPVVTNNKLLLSSYFNTNTWLFDDVESMILVTNQALNSSDSIREQKALNAKKVLYGFFDMNVTFFKNLKTLK